jgi:hypothetical protein
MVSSDTVLVLREHTTWKPAGMAKGMVEAAMESGTYKS